MHPVHFIRLRPGILRCNALLLGAALLASPGARASLGSDTASIAADRVQLGAVATVAAHPRYEVHELTQPNGTVVREYVNSAGLVFAVGWEGPALPNLQRTLGTWFDAYVSAAGANPDGHHHLTVRSSDLVVVSTGRMRAFAGHAWLASALPAGVSIGELN